MDNQKKFAKGEANDLEGEISFSELYENSENNAK